MIDKVMAGKFHTVKTNIRLVARDETFTINSLATTLINQGGIVVTINRNLVLEPGDQVVLPYAQGTVNKTVLEAKFGAPGNLKLLVLTTELSE